MLYFIVSTIIFLAALPILYWLHRQAKLDVVTTPVPPSPGGPPISVIIPARNEERNIKACIEAVLAQDYSNFEVLVLDDRSTDSTPVILAELSAHEPRLVVLFGKELPEGWAGKPHALYQAAKSATGEWLCFIDADTFIEPNALSATLAKANESGADLYSIVTTQLTGSFWEKTVQPIVLTAFKIVFSPQKINDPKHRDAIANGQFILIKRSVYDAVGGYEVVKNQIVEDKALAEQVKWNGYKLVLAEGYAMAKTRMYTSLSTLWEGWTKNIYLSLKGHPTRLLWGAFGASLALVMAFGMPLWTLLAAAWGLNGGGLLAVMMLVESLVVWSVLFHLRARAAQAMKISGWYALTTPIGAAVFAAMILVSAWKVLSGRGVSWKGRTYDPKVIR